MAKLGWDTFGYGLERAVDAANASIPSELIYGTAIGGDVLAAAHGAISRITPGPGRHRWVRLAQEFLLGALKTTDDARKRFRDVDFVQTPPCTRMANQAAVLELDNTWENSRLTLYSINQRLQEYE